MERGYLSILILNDIKVKWKQGSEVVKELSILQMEGLTEVSGRTMKKTGMEQKKESTIMRDSGKMD